MKATATFTGNEIEAEFEAEMERCDYCVGGSPVWWEPSNVKLISLKIFGVEVLHHLPPEAVKQIAAEIETDLALENQND